MRKWGGRYNMEKERANYGKCGGFKVGGQPCRYYAKENGFCHFHQPKTPKQHVELDI